MTLIWLALAGFVAWTVSTLAGGGGALLLVPAVSYLIGTRAVAPVVTLTAMLGSPARIYLFWEHIDWKIVRWYLPGAVVGALAGAWIFSTTQAEWLQIIVGLFLISTVWQYRFGKREQSFEVRLWYFLPAGLTVSFFSGLIGATGPVLNPLYLNYGAIKEEMIATKSVSSFVMHLIKIGTYTALGALSGSYLLFGLAAGLAAVAANWVGKRWLKKLTEERFRQLVIAVMVVSGISMLWGQRDILVNLLRGAIG
ncbi:MAG TPA: sulfite exporter TauE/SafE family protein [Longimicrobiaceae bacterium]|nr:sulfite exporter TauE/SafE family protein [Longimicrobiaceae bacterium]